MTMSPWKAVEDTMSAMDEMPLSPNDVSNGFPGVPSTWRDLPSVDACQAVTQRVITADDVRGSLGRVRQRMPLANAPDFTAPLTAEILGRYVATECENVTDAFLKRWKRAQGKKITLDMWHLQKSQYILYTTRSDSEAAIQRLRFIADKMNVSLRGERPETTGYVLGLSEQNFKDMKELITDNQSCPFRTGSIVKDVYEQYGFVKQCGFVSTGHKKHNKMWAGWKTYLWLKILVDFESLLGDVQQCAKDALSVFQKEIGLSERAPGAPTAALIEFQKENGLSEQTAASIEFEFEEELVLSETAPEASTAVQQRCKEKCLFCDHACTQFLAVEAGTSPQVTDEGVFCDQLKGEMCEVINRTATVQATVKDIQRFDFQDGVFICKGCFPKTERNYPPEIINFNQTVYQTHFFWRKIFTINPTNSNDVKLYISNDTSELRGLVSNVREIDHLEARRPETRKRLREGGEYSELCEKNLCVPLTEDERRRLLGHFHERDLVELITWHYASGI